MSKLESFKNFCYSYWYIGAAILVGLLVILFVVHVLRRRYKTEDQVPNNSSFSVIVTNVGDGDGFKGIHAPWFRSKKIFDEKGKVKKSLPTLSFRLAGVDAPEVAAFEKPAQPFAKESKEFLRHLIVYKMVNVKVLGKDMYGRLLCMVFLKSWFRSKNINSMMVKTGLACVFTGKCAVYGGRKAEFQALEKEAQKKRLGMWSQKKIVTPMAHKAKYR